jgi:hypothetical protein
MPRPILLTQEELLEPINIAIQRVDKIRQLKNQDTDKIILEGLFALIVSSFENAVLDTIRVVLKRIPEKLDKTPQITKKDLLEGDAISKAIDAEIRRIGYDNIKVILESFVKVTGLSANLLEPATIPIGQLIEVKATRNLLLHNDLKMNSEYKAIAGQLTRSTVNGRLPIDQPYLLESINVISQILHLLRSELIVKYADYSRFKALKNLFDYMFQTPLLRFETSFIFDSENTHIIACKPQIEYPMGDLSSSERLFLNLWISHISGREFNFPTGAFQLLDNINKQKLQYFISVVEILIQPGIDYRS